MTTGLLPPGPMSLLSVLAINPDQSRGGDLTNAELGHYLQSHIGTLDEQARNTRHRLRDELYHDGGCAYMDSVIDDVFTDERLKRLRKKWVRHARFNNSLKRIVNELSTVYAEPAKRTVSSTGADNYAKLLKAIAFDEQMLQMSRLLNLHRVMLVALRVRDTTVVGDDGRPVREPVLDLTTPADARVVLHPNDNKLPVAWVIRACHKPARGYAAPDLPKWTLWSDVERVTLRDDLSVISVERHGLGVNPWVPVTLGPVVGGFWPGEEGEDLVAARIMIWFQDVLLAKESKSATKQPIVQGDGVMTARGQAADSEIPNEIADGQSITTVDMSMDVSIFRDTADHVLDSAGYNYGLSPAIVKNQGVQSAEARKLLRIPLGEIRKHQQAPLRRFEERFAVVMGSVISVDLPAWAFDPSSFKLEFSEEQTPMSAKEELDLFLAGRGAGVDNTIDFIKRKKPGMSDEEARAEMIANIAIELDRNRLMRPLQAVSGSMGAGSERLGAGAMNHDAPGAGAPASPNSLPVTSSKAGMGAGPSAGPQSPA